MKKNQKTKQQSGKITTITQAAVIAALYAVLTLVLGEWSFGSIVIQLRLSEILTILPLFTFSAVPGLTVGCVLANLIGFALGFNFSPWDILFGSLATLIAAIITYIIGKKADRMFKIWVGPFPAVIINAVIIGGELTYFYSGSTEIGIFLINALSVFIGEAILCYVLGVPLILSLLNRDMYKKIFKTTVTS